jgi:hypothetical protein
VRMITRFVQSVANLGGCRDGDGATGGSGRLADTPASESEGRLRCAGDALERALLTTLQGLWVRSPRFSVPLMQQPRISGASESCGS